MIPQAHITAWRAVAPWGDDAQVEQDLVLSRAVVERFTDAELTEPLAPRGGTALDKPFIHLHVHLRCSFPPQARRVRLP